MKTIVLGAGASRAESNSMPLVGDFFRKMFSRFPMDDRAGVEFLQSVADDFGVTPEHIRNDRIHIEELLTLLDCHASWYSGEKDEARRTTSFPEVVGALAARDSLSYMMSGLLFDAQRSAFESGASLHHQIAQSGHALNIRYHRGLG